MTRCSKASSSTSATEDARPSTDEAKIAAAAQQCLLCVQLELAAGQPEPVQPPMAAPLFVEVRVGEHIAQASMVTGCPRLELRGSLDLLRSVMEIRTFSADLRDEPQHILSTASVDLSQLTAHELSSRSAQRLSTDGTFYITACWSDASLTQRPHADPLADSVSPLLSRLNSCGLQA